MRWLLLIPAVAITIPFLWFVISTFAGVLALLPIMFIDTARYIREIFE